MQSRMKHFQHPFGMGALREAISTTFFVLVKYHRYWQSCWIVGNIWLASTKDEKGRNEPYPSEAIVRLGSWVQNRW